MAVDVHVVSTVVIAPNMNLSSSIVNDDVEVATHLIDVDSSHHCPPSVVVPSVLMAVQKVASKVITGVEDKHVAKSGNGKSSVAFGVTSTMRGFTPAVMPPGNSGRLNFNITAAKALVLNQDDFTPVGSGLNVEVGTIPSPVVRVSDGIRERPSWVAGTGGIIASSNTADIHQR